MRARETCATGGGAPRVDDGALLVIGRFSAEAGARKVCGPGSHALRGARWPRARKGSEKVGSEKVNTTTREVRA